MNTAVDTTTSAGAKVLVETSHDLPLVSVAVALRVGTAVDPPGKEGLGRLVARLMRRTAGGLSADENEVRIDSMGAALHAEASASSLGMHGTTITRSLEPFTELMADAMARPSFDEAELNLLKRETAAELVEVLDNDRSVTQRWFRRELFKGHPYGRSSGGTRDSIAAITLDDVRQHYAKLFRPENLIFAFAGDIETDAAALLTDRITQGLSSGAPLVDPVPEPTPVSGRRLLLADKPQRTQTQILIGCLGTHPQDEDHTALHVANTIFGGTFTARLTQEVRAKRGWSYGAYSSLPYDRRRHAFSMWTFPKASDAAACIRLELDLLHAWREKGVTKKELAWAKRYLVRSHAFALDTASKRVGMALDTELFDLPAGYYENYIERVQATTLEQVNASIKNRISEEDLLVTVLGTEADIGDGIRQTLDNLAHSEVVPFDAVC